MSFDQICVPCLKKMVNHLKKCYADSALLWANMVFENYNHATNGSMYFLNRTIHINVHIVKRTVYFSLHG